ncbi:hypothetical protein MSAN_01515600 [Mycena sanguinolenta]|uniref:Uncharacterized protein n=1 Tax=Mycena sanguinolenta TaxID=230812 RepID=A0A8H7CYX0_9AGAR|nr:hypothetical protein MSAN_01515600 [Mycena sanguinolenta]
MDLQPHSDVVSTMNNAGSAAYAGAFFPQATGFNIRGGGFTSNVTNNVYNPPPEQSSGDIKLIQEFKEMRSSLQSSLVGRQNPGASVRRVYTAKLEGHQSGHMTVAMYEGEGAEEAWNQHLAKYEAVRHPNIMQLYGLVSTRRLRGMVFHDELIPYRQFLCRFQNSPILSAYIIGYCPIIKTTEFLEAIGYISNVFPKFSIDYDELPIWIRPPTGELCLDLAPGGPGKSVELAQIWNSYVLRLDNVSLDAPNSENIIISAWTEDRFHDLCFRGEIAQLQFLQVSTQPPVGLGIFRLDSQRDTCVKITEPLILPEELGWNWNQDGVNLVLRPSEITKAWLAQANHIFVELEEVARIEDYVCVDEVQFNLQIAHKRHIPEGYLFVCPSQDFRAGTEHHANSYQWPACPAYWSLDPSGAERLSTQDARNLGFPIIHIETRMFGNSWDSN